MLGTGPSRTQFQRWRKRSSYFKHANWIWSNTLLVRQLPFEAVDRGGNKSSCLRKDMFLSYALSWPFYFLLVCCMDPLPAARGEPAAAGAAAPEWKWLTPWAPQLPRHLQHLSPAWPPLGAFLLLLCEPSSKARLNRLVEERSETGLKCQKGNAAQILVLVVKAHPWVHLTYDTGKKANTAKLKMDICIQRSFIFTHITWYGAENAFNIYGPFWH